MNTQRNKIVWVVIPILFVLVFLIALVLIYSKKEVEPVPRPLTEEERILQSMTADNVRQVSPEEEAKIESAMGGSGNGGSITEAERLKIQNAMSGE